MMSSPQADSLENSSSRLHRIFRRYDPEAAAVVSILLGLIQVVLAVPVYFMTVKPFFYVLPLTVGSLFVTGGSFAFACSKSSDRRLLKGCAYGNLACLLAALVAVCVYIMALYAEFPDSNDCDDSNLSEYCSHGVERLHQLFYGIVGSLLVYDMAAMVLHSLLSYSAVKGLKID